MVGAAILVGGTGAALLALGPRPAGGAVAWALVAGLVLGRGGRDDTTDLHLELEEPRKQLEALALRDPLTGVLNHRAFQDALETELRRARRESWSVAIVAIDIDGFRELNDRAGHGHGDAVLVAVGQGLASNLRPGDLCGRMGGDEFMLALSRCDAGGAKEAVARLKSAIEGRALSADVGAVSLSV